MNVSGFEFGTTDFNSIFSTFITCLPDNKHKWYMICYYWLVLIYTILKDKNAPKTHKHQRNNHSLQTIYKKYFNVLTKYVHKICTQMQHSFLNLWNLYIFILFCKTKKNCRSPLSPFSEGSNTKLLDLILWMPSTYIRSRTKHFLLVKHSLRPFLTEHMCHVIDHKIIP